MYNTLNTLNKMEDAIMKAHLGEFISEYRERNKLSIRDFAQRANLSNGYISMLENNRNPVNGKPLIPTIETYNKVARAMGMELDDLISQIDGNARVTINASKRTFDAEEAASILQEITERPELRRIMIALSQFTEQELHDLHNLFLKMMSFGDKSDK